MKILFKFIRKNIDSAEPILKNQNNIKMSSLDEIVENTNEKLYFDDSCEIALDENTLRSMKAGVSVIQEDDTLKPENTNCGKDEISLSDIKIDMDKSIATESCQLTRKSKKRKRHYNVNKNKKWNKTYKRQKMNNITKADVESASQSSRKHMYTKVPKIIFNNKQAMHRGGLSKFFLPDKRPRDIIVPPTKFLLGGNISDPLNLNSLQDEALVSISAVTPKSSPIVEPKVEVIIPPNIYDPLHLLDPVDSIEYEKQLVSPIKNRRLNRQRIRKKKIRKIDENEAENIANAEVASSDILNFSFSPKEIDLASDPEEIGEQSDNMHIEDVAGVEEKARLNKEDARKRKSSECLGFSNTHSGCITKKIRRFDSKDKIVSPVIPQPGAWKRLPKVQLGAPRNRNRTTSSSGN